MTSINLETLFTIIYVLVDDWYQTNCAVVKGKPGVKAELKDSEVLTLMIGQDYIPYPGERQYKGVEIPFRLESRQYIDFTGNFDQGMARLYQHIDFLKSSSGELQRMKDQLADAKRDLRRATDDLQRVRIQDEMAQLETEVKRLQAIVDDPRGAALRTQQSIEAGLERQRQPVSIPRMASTKFINPSPGMAPPYFQDRHIETQLVADFLNNPTQHLLTIVGRGGVGKTAMVCRLLKGLETEQLPDDLGELKVDGIIYLSMVGTQRVNFGNLYADLAKLLPQNIAEELDAFYREPQISTTTKVQKLLSHFPDGRVIVLLDNMEDGINPETRQLTDSEVDEALKAILDDSQHAIKVIMTTRLAPRQLRLYQPGRQGQIELDEGLQSPYAENILRAMDADGKLGPKTASDDLFASGTTHQIDFFSQGLCNTAYVDVKLLHHILGNLLSNAIKYSPEQSSVKFTATCEPDQIVFYIQDQGIGIPYAEQTQLFEPFHRASNAKQIAGTGLGLVIVKQSVDLHGGSVRFESEEGQGTTFIITLPQTASEK